MLTQNSNKVLISKCFLLNFSLNNIFESTGLLVNLLNCDSSQHFTTSALKKIKVLDDRPRHEVTQNQNKFVVVGSMPQTQPVVSKVVPSQAQISQNHVIENEVFAVNWLNQNYEVNLDSKVLIRIHGVYADYVKYCCKISRKNVVALPSFNFLIKKCFPQCKINVQASSIEGLIGKNSSNIAVTPQQMVSPILKAHLSTPPKVGNTPQTNETTVSATTATSTLIKSLLANKLRNNQGSQNIVPAIDSQPVTNGTKSVTSDSSSSISTPTTTTTPVQTPVQSQQQQLYLVRTIITGGPGQSTSNTPVRLIVPASMIQQRMPAPQTVAQTINKSETPRNSVETDSPIATPTLSVSESVEKTQLPESQEETSKNSSDIEQVSDTTSSSNLSEVSNVVKNSSDEVASNTELAESCSERKNKIEDLPLSPNKKMKTEVASEILEPTSSNSNELSEKETVSDPKVGVELASSVVTAPVVPVIANSLPIPQPPAIPDLPLDFECQWDNCNR